MTASTEPTEPTDEVLPHWAIGLEDEDRAVIAFALNYLANDDRMPTVSGSVKTLGKVAQIATTQEQALQLLAKHLSKAQLEQPQSFDLGTLGRLTSEQWFGLLSALPLIVDTFEELVDLGRDVTTRTITIQEAFERVKALAVSAEDIIEIVYPK